MNAAKFFQAILFLFFAVSVIALGARELHRDYAKERRRDGVMNNKEKNLAKKLHDPHDAMKASFGESLFQGGKRLPQGKSLQAEKLKDEVSREDRSELGKLIDEVVK